MNKILTTIAVKTINNKSNLSLVIFLLNAAQHPNIRIAYNKQIYGYLVFRISRISTTLFLLKKLLIISQLCRVANEVANLPSALQNFY
jgi:hypothetical protein